MTNQAALCTVIRDSICPCCDMMIQAGSQIYVPAAGQEQHHLGCVPGTRKTRAQRAARRARVERVERSFVADRHVRREG